MGVLHHILQGKHLGGVDFLLAADGSSRAQLWDTVVYHVNFNNLLVTLYLDMVDVGIGEIPLGRLQLPDDPVAQRDILKGEHAIFI